MAVVPDGGAAPGGTSARPAVTACRSDSPRRPRADALRDTGGGSATRGTRSTVGSGTLAGLDAPGAAVPSVRALAPGESTAGADGSASLAPAAGPGAGGVARASDDGGGAPGDDCGGDDGVCVLTWEVAVDAFRSQNDAMATASASTAITTASQMTRFRRRHERSTPAAGPARPARTAPAPEAARRSRRGVPIEQRGLRARGDAARHAILRVDRRRPPGERQRRAEVPVGQRALGLP